MGRGTSTRPGRGLTAVRRSRPHGWPPNSSARRERSAAATTSGSTSSRSTSSCRRGNGAGTARASAAPCTACCSSATSTTVTTSPPWPGAQCAAEGVIGLDDRVAALARSALATPIVRSVVAGAEHWRELFVAATVGDRVLEGYVDLLVRTPERPRHRRLQDRPVVRCRSQTGRAHRALPAAARRVRGGARIGARRADLRRHPRALRRRRSRRPDRDRTMGRRRRRGSSAGQLILVGGAVTTDPHRAVIRHGRDRRPAELEHALAGEPDEHPQEHEHDQTRRTRSRSARRSWRAAPADRRTAGSSRRNRRRCRRPSACAPGRRPSGSRRHCRRHRPRRCRRNRARVVAPFDDSAPYSGSNPAPTRYCSPTSRNR